MLHLRSYGSGSVGKEKLMFLNNISKWMRGIAFLVVALFCLAGAARAQEKSPGSDAPKEESAANDQAQVNNPLANFTAFNLHNYYIGELTDPDKDAGWPEWQIFIGINTQFK